MPSTALTSEFHAMRREHAAASEALVPLTLRMALDSVAEVLPGARTLQVFGRLSEDWIPTLRIQRVLDEQGEVLFDIEVGHDSRKVEDTVDEVGSDYLDLVLDLTGDDYMGARTIDRLDVESAQVGPQ
ncbi:MAG: hypothetical protein WA797_03640 [Acidimicrobiales bacterium]